MAPRGPLFLIVFVLAAFGCAQPEERPADTSAPRSVAPAGSAATASRPRIVFLGDSLTAGYGLAQEQSIPSLIQQRLRDEGYDYDVVNAGVSGDTSAGGLSRLEWSLEGDVKVLVVELGGNDGLRGLPAASMKRNLAEIITRAKRRGIQVVLTGMEAPRNWGPQYVAEFRRVFSDLAKEHDVAFMPFFLEGVAVDARLNLPDGIHPNPEGARIVAGNVWRILEPLLED